MIWWLLIIAAIVALPLVIEHRRLPMDDMVRGSATGQFVKLSKGVTHFEWHGPASGTRLVCIHGLTTPSFVWRGMTRGLVLMGFRVLTYDLYGRGYSDRPKGEQNAAFFLSQLQELLALEGDNSKITLIGYSMGGAIATCYAAAYPDKVRQLVLLAPAGMGIASGKLGRFIAKTPYIGDWLMLTLYPRMLRKGLRAERGLTTSLPDIGMLQARELEYRRFVPSVLASLRGILSKSLRDEHQALHARGMSVVAIWGEDDTVIPLAAIGTLAEWSRDARQEVIKGAGHGLTYTHTDKVLAILKDALIKD